jgi:hypothetical protein
MILSWGGGVELASQSLDMIGTLDKILKKSEIYIPMFLQCTLHFRPQLNFCCFLLMDSAVGMEHWPDVLSTIANTFYQSPVSGD